MRDQQTSVAALIAGYRACERPSPETKAAIVRALADAGRQPAPPVRRNSAAPWLALAAGIVLLLAWRAASRQHATRTADDGAGLASFAAAKARASIATRHQPIATPPAPVDPAPEVHAPSKDDKPPPPASEGTRRKPAPRPTAPVDVDAGAAVLEEMALLQRAQAALRAQRADEALALLAEHQDDFPRGALAEEREALRVAALCGAGAAQQGLAARATFMRTYPRSPYAARVLAACPGSSDDDLKVRSP